jgi:5-methylcytosine-specific restriction protein A
VRATGFSVVVRALIRERGDGYCEICGRSPFWGQAHHRRPRGAGGSKRNDTNLPSNALWLCSGPDGCHENVESNRALAYDNGWLVHQGANPREVAVLRRGEWCQLLDDGSIVPVEIEVAQ